MHHSSPSPTKRTAAWALLLVLAMSGCNSTAESSSGATWSNPDTAPTATGSSPSTRDAEPSASPTVEESRKAKTTPKSPAPQKSKAPSGGGTKYPECADGDCKVSFSGSTTFSLRGWTVSAAREKDGVRVRLTKPNGWGGGGAYLAGPGCTLAIHGDGGARLGCDKPQIKPDPGGYVVHLLKLNGRTAVIRAVLG